jgi:hypothetical protein
MKSSIRRAHSKNPARNGFDDATALDWDAAVRSAFLEGCLGQGVRAEAARIALSDIDATEPEPLLREQMKAAALGAALGWLKLETCLARYGELAALALARCLDEAELDIRSEISASSTSKPRSSSVGAPDSDAGELVSPAARASQVVPRCGTAVRVAIVQRARERLERFWRGDEFRAA